MSTEPPQKLLKRWQQGDLTVEQAIGQFLSSQLLLSGQIILRQAAQRLAH